MTTLEEHIKYRMKMIRADHALSTGYHKRYLTGQYDAYDDILKRLQEQSSACDRCEELKDRLTINSNGEPVCRDCWVDGEDRE